MKTGQPVLLFDLIRFDKLLELRLVKKSVRKNRCVQVDVESLSNFVFFSDHPKPKLYTWEVTPNIFSCIVTASFLWKN